MCPKGLLYGRIFAESPKKTRAIQSAFLQADCGKIVSVFSVGARPLLQGVPSFKQSTGLFEIHPLPSAQSVRVFRRLRTAARALPLTRQPFLREKAGPKNLSCLWQVLIGSADPQTRIYSSMHIVQLWVFSWECFFSNSFSELYYFFGIRCRRHLVPKKQ